MKELLNEWKKFLNEQNTMQRAYTEWLKDYIKKAETIGGKPDKKSYLDTGGVVTVGYGSTYKPDGTRVKKNEKITVSKAEQYLTAALNQAAIDINNVVTKDLTENQFDAMIAFVYNVGIGNLQNSALLKLINNNPNDPEIRKQFLLFINDKSKKPLEHNKERRKFEADLYFTPDGSKPAIPETIVPTPKPEKPNMSGGVPEMSIP